MFEKYTEQARRTIFFARYEVSELGGDTIDPEHLLLGLLREDKTLLPLLLHERDEPAREAIRSEIEAHIRSGEKLSTSVEISLSAEAKAALLNAAEESEGMSHKHIGTEHLLLGVLRIEGSFAAGVPGAHGITHEVAREALRDMYGEQ
jgi:ATP-dependent Clp protease ATP-binding subunit ClpC